MVQNRRHKITDNFHINNYREDYSQIRNEMCSNNYEIMLTPNNVTNISEKN